MLKKRIGSEKCSKLHQHQKRIAAHNAAHKPHSGRAANFGRLYSANSNGSLDKQLNAGEVPRKSLVRRG
jgi:hypothetical protein